MKNGTFFIILLLAIACSGPKKGENGLPTLNVTVDTVMIDPGQEILFLNRGLRLSTLSEDKKYLYNINLKEYSIEQINLNSLEFEQKHTFEKEGPNGVGDYIRGFSLVNQDILFLSSYPKESLFDWQGNRLESFNIIEMGKAQGKLEEGDRPFKTISLSADGQQFASLIANDENKTSYFALIDRDNKIFKKLAIPAIEKSRNFELLFNDGTTAAYYLGVDRYLIKEGGKIILGTGVSNELYVMDKTYDSLQHITFNSQLTPNEKSGSYPSEIGNRSQFDSYFKKIQEDINFKGPVWDEKNQVYYRFSYQMVFDDNAEQKENQFFSQPSGANVYLSVLDKDLKLIAEGTVPKLNGYPAFHFGKDGRLWLFENIEDEMGFVRLDISW
jgi:hypothetical protein